MVTRADIETAIVELGLAGQAIGLHSSLSSFGWVEGGADTVVEAFVRQGCTIVVPTHSYTFYMLRHAPGEEPQPDGREPFTTASNLIDVKKVGSIPAAALQRPGRVRGYHPVDSFTALGPLAEELGGCQVPEDIYAPVKGLVRRNGYLLLAGVGLNRLTAIHLAETWTGRQLNPVWALGLDGRPFCMKVGGCSEGFVNLDPVVRPIETRRMVGESLWRLFPPAPLLEMVAEAIRREPTITCCDNPNCAHCRRIEAAARA
jgi:hypothetical protein